MRSFVIFVAFWVGMHAGVVAAQQSLFNAPSTVHTTDGELFVQEQLTLAGAVESNTTVDFGIGDWAEVGVDVLHVGTTPVAAANASVVFPIVDDLTMQIGGVFGASIGPDASSTAHQRHADTTFDQRLYAWAWATARLELFEERVALVAGGYLGDHVATGGQDLGGAIAGVEIMLVPQRLHFVADILVGIDALDVAVVGLAAVLDEWQFSMGVQLPSPGAPTDMGLVFELTRTTPPREHAAPAEEAD